MTADTTEWQQAARDAFAECRWQDTLALLERIEERQGLTPDEYFLRGEASMMSSSRTATLRAYERAFQAYQAAGRRSEAAIIAVSIWRVHGDRGESGPAMGWLRRAQRLLEGQPACAGLAHVEVVLAFMAQQKGALTEAAQHAERALEIAKELSLPDVEAMAIARQGRILIRQGRVADGQALLDEAMVVAGADGANPVVRALVYCNVISACSDLADYERASEWTEDTLSWTEQRSLSGFPGVCRIHRAEFLRLEGRWGDAEREAEEACDQLDRLAIRIGVAWGIAERGMLRLLAGDLDGAETAFRDAHQIGYEAQPGSAMLLRARGQVEAAQRSIRRAMDERAGDAVARAKLLPTLIEIEIEAGDLEAAERAARELSETAATCGTGGLLANAQAARARVALANADAVEAIAAARAAVSSFTRLGIPYESARARELLARSYEAAGDGAHAQLERDAARATMTSLTQSVPASVGVAAPFAPTLVAPGEVAVGAVSSGSLHDKIEILRVIGRGGMGTVAEGRHRVTGRRVAVKTLNAALCGEPNHCQRLLQEALACGRVRHQHVVDVYDAGLQDGEPYVVMEYLEGLSLAARLAQHPRMPVPEAVDILRQAAAGVGAAHAAGVIHRDLKPDNLFLATDGDGYQVKVLDFGISKLADGKGGTRAGDLLGTPCYMAPEQIHEAHAVDGRVDVYALGAVLYEMLSGSPPFQADTYPAVLQKVLHEPFPSVTEARSDVPEPVLALLTRATARPREERFATMSEFSAAIVECL